LNEITIAQALNLAEPQLIVTMSQGQWDSLLETAYLTGAVLLELDQFELPVRAFRIQEETATGSSADAHGVAEKQ
jgi:hypothetical protein